MKKYFVIILMMVLLAGTVTTVALPPVIEKCKTCGLPIGRCKYKGKHPAKTKQETSKQNRGNNRQSAAGTSNGMTKAQRDRVLRELENNMVWVEGGTFTMGVAPKWEQYARDDEKPAHQVTLTGFYICKYEVTQELWLAVMGNNPSEFKGNSHHPVEMVSWNDCQRFIAKLNKLTGKNYRLPTEAEWEYAARGGRQQQDFMYAGSDNIGDVAWYGAGSGDDICEPTTYPVGAKAPNGLGLYDMSGNVYEWCADWYGSYSSNSQNNPSGPSRGSDRVRKGGNWLYFAGSSRVSFRGHGIPTERDNGVGLRLAL